MIEDLSVDEAADGTLDQTAEPEVSETPPKQRLAVVSGTILRPLTGSDATVSKDRIVATAIFVV